MWMQKQKLAHMPPINRADVKNWVFGEPIHTLFSLNILHRYYYYLWKEYYLCQRANYCLLADGFFNKTGTMSFNKSITIWTWKKHNNCLKKKTLHWHDIFISNLYLFMICKDGKVWWVLAIEWIVFNVFMLTNKWKFLVVTKSHQFYTEIIFIHFYR